jgi:hypothetical protein
MTFKVQAQQCSTCIFRKDSVLSLKALLKEIADPKMKGFFIGYRECHHADRDGGVCCKGFWDSYKDHFQAGQIAQRLNLVEFVDIDCLAD